MKTNCYSAALIAAAGLSGGTASATPVMVDFLLDPPTASINNVPVTVSATVLGSSSSDTQNTTLSGNALADLDLTFDASGNVTSANTIKFTGGEIYFDDDATFTLSFLFGAATVKITTTDLSAQLSTPGGPAPIAGSSIDLTAHTLTVNHGTLIAKGTGLASGVSQSTDFATSPLAAPLIGTASIDIQLNQVLSGIGSYTATINAPFTFSQDFDSGNGVIATDTTSGILASTAQFTYELYLDDGDIDDADLGSAFANYTGPGGTGRTPSQGDTDGDGDIDDADLGLLFASYTGPLAPAVPEPASAALIGVGVLALGRRRRA